MMRFAFLGLANVLLLGAGWLMVFFVALPPPPGSVTETWPLYLVICGAILAGPVSFMLTFASSLHVVIATSVVGASAFTVVIAFAIYKNWPKVSIASGAIIWTLVGFGSTFQQVAAGF
jgi:hypothetical protein